MRTLAAILALGLAASAVAQSPCALVADINTGNGGKASSSPRRLMCAFGGSLLFYARNATDWGVYRAAPNGQVQRLADFRGLDMPLVQCNTPQGARVFFIAHHATAGTELHVTDGTVAGTKLVRDIRPGVLPPAYGLFTPFGDRLLFSVYDYVNGWEPFVSDGTTAGTLRLKEIKPGRDGSDPRDITPAGNYALFTADDGVVGREVWVTDGTPAGTKLLKDTTSALREWPKELTRFGNRVLFSAHDPAAGRELWVSDGTTTGTVRLMDINPGAKSSNPNSFQVVGDRVFFAADDGTHGNELWVTDGTKTGTRMVANLNTGASAANPMYLTACHGKLYFLARVLSRNKAYVSDGTAAGTFELHASAQSPRRFVAANGKVFFAAYDHRGQELWVTDGTKAGTKIVKDIHPAGSSNPNHLTPTGNGVCFYGDDGTTGPEIWFSDGTAAGTQRVCDLNPGAAGSYPREFTICGGHLFFNATTASKGEELFWIKTPGATADPIGGASEPGRPTLSIAGTRQPVLGSPIRFEGRGPANHAGFLVLGLPTDLPLPPVPGILSRGADWVGALTPASAILTNTTSRTLSLSLTVPSAASFDGARVNLQAWWLPLAPLLRFQVSNGLQLTLSTGRPK